MNKRLGWLFCAFVLNSANVYAGNKMAGQIVAPQSTACVTGQFSIAPGGNEYWSTVNLTITNHCAQAVDMQNAVIQFNSDKSLNTSVWGDFSAVSYPNPSPAAVSASEGDHYRTTIRLQFPEGDAYWKPNTKLAAGKTIVLNYGEAKPGYDADSVRVYLNQPPVETGTIELINQSSQPAGVSTTPVIDIYNGQTITQQISLGWNSHKSVPVAPGTYTIKAESFQIGNTTYTGSVQPEKVTVEANKTVSSSIHYQATAKDGVIDIQMPALPSELKDYSQDVQVTLTDALGGSTGPKAVKWNQSNVIHNLVPLQQYTFSTPVISQGGFQCTASFNPASITAAEDISHPATAKVQYQCAPVKQDVVNIDVSGLNKVSSVSSIQLRFTPNNNSKPVEKEVNLNNGAGTATVMLDDAVVYSVASSDVTGYSVSIKPASFVAQEGIKVNVSYGKIDTSRVVGPFVDTTAWPFYHFADAAAEADNKIARLGFVVADRNNQCNATWGTYYEIDGFADLANEVTRMQAQGRNVVPSFGGQANLPLEAACTTPESLKAQIVRVIDAFHVKQIDFDIEGDAPAHQDRMDRLAQAIVLLQKDPAYKDIKISYTLAVLPEGLTDGINALNSAAKVGAQIAYVNIMAMDYGYPASNMGELAAKAAVSTVNQIKKIYPEKSEAEIWAMIGVTPMIGKNDTQGETFTLNDACYLKQFADQKNIGLLSMWSANRDNGNCPNGGAAPNCSGVAQTTNEFQKIFSGKQAC
ncbi:chitinase [Aquicella lusitana]|uniref:Glycosyl hydrolase family 18 (Putative chitinase) n=1 Tax=Aquicella lusitana TaxID=254246 RepID=A0A370GC86_9COXI|nr:chitinase [Aquicella lusitana]RDI41317.1 glycosyl hydrolase family 18 (putative chitinase) [Aquicella lusitana]VVC72316.1 putative bifunctional chitinase/lysozyme [Aquicella lusitana]